MRQKTLKREEGELQVSFLTVWPVYQEASMLNTFYFLLNYEEGSIIHTCQIHVMVSKVTKNIN